MSNDVDTFSCSKGLKKLKAKNVHSTALTTLYIGLCNTRSSWASLSKLTSSAFQRTRNWTSERIRPRFYFFREITIFCEIVYLRVWLTFYFLWHLLKLVANQNSHHGELDYIFSNLLTFDYLFTDLRNKDKQCIAGKILVAWVAYLTFEFWNINLVLM